VRALRLVRTGRVLYDEELLGLMGVFEDRGHAGALLAEACVQAIRSADLVYAIPRGGVPVAVPVAGALGAELDLLICRKLLIPWNREAGFGAVSPDGHVYVDQRLARALGLTREEVREAIDEQLREVAQRNERLRGGRGYPRLDGKRVVLVDDGIAAGYTMGAAAKFVRARGASELVIAVPTGHLEAVLRLAELADLLICLNLRSGPVFAVADAYRRWRDLTDEDVLRALKRAR